VSLIADDIAENPSRSEADRPAPLSPVRPFYWSVRREIWENRSLYVAPLVVAAIVLFGYTIGSRFMAVDARTASALGDGPHDPHLWQPYAFACAAIVVTAMIAAAAYCLGALHGERRDRSILFWKSLPVSDLIAVTAKMSVPMVATPVIAFAISMALQALMLVIGTVALALHGLPSGPLWSAVLTRAFSPVLPWGVVALTLWYAPIWAWLLLVSGFARRVAFLWAVLPPMGVCLAEKIAFDTSRFASAIGYRLTGATGAAFSGRLSNGDFAPDPIGFLTTPGLWGGLIVAVVLLAATIWQRRNRGPL
jgi:ABC-2 type transport system permease protein